MSATDHKILIINETVYMEGNDGHPVIYESGKYQVSTRKIDAFRDSNEFEYRYVDGTIEDALKGATFRYGSRKYSFGDCPEWYDALKPDSDCQDPVHEIEVEINI